MKRLCIMLLCLLFTLVATAALAAHHAVKIAEQPGLGKYLTDTEGKTLYYFKMDAPGKSACVGDCLTRWPLYYRETAAATGTLKAEDFGTLQRSDGQNQTTYKGYPLYYWIGDSKAGDTKGQGVKDVWFVVNPENFPPK